MTTHPKRFIVTTFVVGLVGCGAGGPLADHVSEYCNSLQSVLGAIAIDSNGRPTKPIGFETWPAVYDRFVFCAEARADSEAAEPLAAEFRVLVQRLDEGSPTQSDQSDSYAPCSTGSAACR